MKVLHLFLYLVFILQIPNAAANDNVANKSLSHKKQMELLDQMSKSDAEIERVAKEYESIAVNKMLQQMHEGVKPDPVLGGGHAEEVYKDLLLTEYAKIISDNGGIGIRDSIVRDMKRINNPNLGRYNGTAAK